MDGHRGMRQVPRGMELKRREIMRRMRRPLACIGVLAAILCLWTVVTHAITLYVTDDTFTQKEAPNAQSGSATSLSVNNRTLSKEHITYALFDLSLLPPNAALDKAVVCPGSERVGAFGGVVRLLPDNSGRGRPRFRQHRQ